MVKRVFILCSLFIGIGIFLASCSGEEKPNVVFILVDDLGWTDLGCFGSDFYQTPHIDALAASGVKFSNAYAACTVCSPTRASVMTGKYPATLNCTDWITGHKYPWAQLAVPDWTMKVDTSAYTMAEAFKSSGYVTAHMGKWHLGDDSIYWPEHQGFDINIGGWSKGMPNRNKKLGSKGYFSPYGNPRMEDGPEGEYLTDRLAEEAAAFIQENKKKPFFLNLCFYNVHTPLMAKEEVIEKYDALVDSSKLHMNAIYAAMVEHTDDAVGRVIASLEEAGIVDNTIVVFTSDNGGLIGRGKRKVTNNTPLRDGKGSIYEGGTRVPLIMYVPGERAIKESEQLVFSGDYFPTLAALCGLELPEHVSTGFDGMNIAAALEGDVIDRSLFWHYPHYHSEGAKPYSAVRDGDWKLIYTFEDEGYQLYNLTEDISERHELSASNPEKLQEMIVLLEKYWKETEAQFPSENPDYDPEKASHSRWK